MTVQINDDSHSCLPSFLSFGRTVSRFVLFRTRLENTGAAFGAVDNSRGSLIHQLFHSARLIAYPIEYTAPLTTTNTTTGITHSIGGLR